jgi:predicted P-loop ATPase
MSSREVNPNPGPPAEFSAADDIRRAVGFLFRPGDVVEVRVPKAGRHRTISGYFSDSERLVEEVERLEGSRFPGVYWTINPVTQALLGRADHKLKTFAENTTSDADIVRRLWLPVDLDPRRPSGISSSDAERAAALDLAQFIRAQLTSDGWPAPILADSGNGAHLLYRLDLPNDAESTGLVRSVLEALSNRHSSDVVAVDVTTYNASRIFKAYGTTARKGDSTEERPHRLSRILEAPDNIGVVPMELLRDLAASVPAKSTARVITMPRQAGAAFDVEAFLLRYGVRHRPPVAFEGGRKFVLEECPWDPSHRSPDAAVFEGADGKLGFKCFHSSCQGRGWREFRERFEPASRNTQAVPAMEDPDAPPWGETVEWWLRADMPAWCRSYLEDDVRKVEKEKRWQWVASYPYTRADGTPVLVKARFLDRANDKTFRQFMLTSKRGWRPKRPGQARDLLYRWPTLAAASEIFLVNGEKAADRGAQQLGLCTTCHVEGEGEWHTAFNDTFRGKNVVVVLDNDDKGEQHGATVARALAGVAVEIRLVRLPGLQPRGDLWDWIEAGGTAEQLRRIVEETAPEVAPPSGGETSVATVSDPPPQATWRNQLLLTDRSEPRALLANVITALRHAPEWEGVLWRDEFAHKTVARKAAPWGEAEKWTDREDGLAANWLQHQDIRVPKEVAGQGVEIVAGDRTFHPVREYLESLTWDGTPRLHEWLRRHLGVELSPYSAAVGSRWLISAVARIFQPGCKADCCLILEGPQGIKKSTTLRTLAEPWFIDHIPELGTKDSLIQVHSAWVIELAELESISRAEVGSIKQFISTQTDTFRPPYGKRASDFPRQCVFAGSVNNNTYLRDETGGRRFWPVKCLAMAIDIDALAEARDQLWAEAVYLYFEGRTWWMDTPELCDLAREEQASRYEDDPWDEVIMRWAEGRESVSIPEVLTQCLDKRKDLWTQLDKNRVVRCLRSRGWERFYTGPRGAREWRYRRTDQGDPA